MSEETQTKYFLALSEEQAQMLSSVLDLVSRVGIGQFEIIEEWARMGSLTNSEGEEVENLEAVRNLIDSLKLHFGHPSNGSISITSERVPVTFRSSYELKKALDREMAMNRNPEPSMKTVNYDGLSMRLTRLPAPKVYSNGGGESEELHNFVGEEMTSLTNFDKHWRSQHLANPEEFPKAVGNYSDWCEQFDLFKELNE